MSRPRHPCACPAPSVRPSRPLRAALAAAAAAALLALAGCGPGTGGTGIPPTPGFVAFDKASVCSAPFAGQLACTGVTTGGAIRDPNLGTSMISFANLQQGGNVSVLFRDNGIELNARCERLRFQGDWGIAASNDARFFGSYAIESSGLPVPANLTVEASGNDLAVVVRENDGRIVLGPVLLQRIVTPVLPAACP